MKDKTYDIINSINSLIIFNPPFIRIKIHKEVKFHLLLRYLFGPGALDSVKSEFDI